MRTVLAMAVLVAALTGCEAGDRGDAGRGEELGDTTMRSADTTITEREVKDTMVVRTDTTVRVDTVKRTGPRDTAGKARRTRP